MSSKSLNVLHIVAWWPHVDGPTEGIFIREQVMTLSKSCNAVVMVVRFELNRSQLIPRFTVEHQAGNPAFIEVMSHCAIRRFGVHEYCIKRAMHLGVKSLRERNFQPDLVHFHVRDHISKIWLKQAYFEDIPWIHSEHFSFYHRGIHELPIEEQEATRQSIHRWFNKPKLKRIISVSNELAETLRTHYGAPPSKLAVIPNVANEVFHYSSSAKRELKVILAANWHAPKNLSVFLQAMQLMPTTTRSQLKVTIIGAGPELDRNAADLRSLLGKNLELLGIQTKSTIASELQTACALIHPTDQENLPSIVIESICCGTPVVSMNVNGLPELISEKNGILVPPKDPQALCDAIEQVIMQRTDYHHEQISNAALKKYSAQAVAQQILSVYESCV